MKKYFEIWSNKKGDVFEHEITGSVILNMTDIERALESVGFYYSLESNSLPIDWCIIYDPDKKDILIDYIVNSGHIPGALKYIRNEKINYILNE
jgi:hypothetical protein